MAGVEPLEHETREALYERIQAEPGTYLSEFEDVSGIDAGFATIRYHLRILERERLVVSQKHKGKRRYYPVGMTPNALSLAMESETPKAIVEALVGTEMTVSELAEAVDRHPSTVSTHLSDLEEEDLVERRRDGEAVVNSLTPGVESMLAEVAEEGARADGGRLSDAGSGS